MVALSESWRWNTGWLDVPGDEERERRYERIARRCEEELAHCRPQPQSFMADEDADVLAVDDDYEER